VRMVTGTFAPAGGAGSAAGVASVALRTSPTMYSRSPGLMARGSGYEGNDWMGRTTASASLCAPGCLHGDQRKWEKHPGGKVDWLDGA